jgi:hypothetical protein
MTGIARNFTLSFSGLSSSLDLPRTHFALEVVELFHGQTVKEFDPALDVKGCLKECVVFFLLGTFKRLRIGYSSAR